VAAEKRYGSTLREEREGRFEKKPIATQPGERGKWGGETRLGSKSVQEKKG